MLNLFQRIKFNFSSQEAIHFKRRFIFIYFIKKKVFLHKNFFTFARYKCK